MQVEDAAYDIDMIYVAHKSMKRDYYTDKYAVCRCRYS